MIKYIVSKNSVDKLDMQNKPKKTPKKLNLNIDLNLTQKLT